MTSPKGVKPQLKEDMSEDFPNVTAVYVYYENPTEINQPRVICIDKGGTRQWYKAQTTSTWTNANESFGTKNPDSLNDTDLDEAAGSENINITPSPNYVIKLDKRPNGTGSNSNIRYRTKNIDVTVEKKENDTANGVPNGYVRYKHTPNGNITGKNKIILKHNGNMLREVEVNQDVSKIFVYYSNSDENYKFPLIFCVKMNNSTQTYYKRGQTWEEADTSLNEVDPEGPNELEKLQGPLDDLKVKYEIKLEWNNTLNGSKYPANPSGQNIAVTPVQECDGFKGFKHDLGDANKVINRITIHGQIVNVENLATGQTISNKQYVYVYFEKTEADGERKKPLLICLAESESASSTNKWYERDASNNWTDVSTGYGNIDPGGTQNRIDEKLKGKLQGITPAEGYEKPDLVVKLDYAPKNNLATIKYRTGDKQVTVTQLTPTTNFKGYKHDVGGATINTIKIHDNDTGITGTDLNDKQFVYVYYANGDDKLQRPYLICLSKTGAAAADPENKWYKRTSSSRNTWRNAPEFKATDDPNSITALENRLRTIKNKLDTPGPDTGYPSSSNDIDASVTTSTETTNDKDVLYGWGKSKLILR